MAAQVDHLAAGRWIRLLRPMVDADGLAFAAGGTWRIDAIAVDTSTLTVTFRLHAAGGDVTMRLDLRAPESPRLGRMRDWFEIVDPPADAPPEPEPAPSPRILSTLANELRSGDIAAAEARVRDLAAHRQYGGENLQVLAERLEAVARELSPVDRDRAAWLYDRAIDCWYGWGALATSGGDGTARASRIEAARARHAAFLAKALGPSPAGEA